MSLPIAKIQDDVKDEFIKQGDNIELYPLFGRKRSFSLNRTQYELRLEKCYKIDVNDIKIILPSLEHYKSSFKLKLNQGSDLNYYTFESVGDVPFKINGNLSYKSIVQNLDELIVGHTKIVFRGKKPFEEGPYFPIAIASCVSRSSLYTLLEGETGTGKSFLARKIHHESKVTGEFVHINISALSEGLVESELFGHIKGAFTGASFNKDGVIKRAQHGTLFIDEIDSLSKEMQVKLLLFLDDRRIRPVGGDRDESIETRIIFASGRSLRELVESGEMRSDFFYRISSGHRIKIPSLRDQRELLDYYLKNFENLHGIVLSKKLISFYSNLNWPGNIRQLYGHLERKLSMSSKKLFVIDERDLELLTEDLDLDVEHGIISLKSLKRKYIKRAYYICGQDVTLAAKALNISYNTVQKNVYELAV